MEDLDLDDIQSEIRKSIRILSDIEIDDKYNKSPIYRIMSEIEEKSKIMIDSNKNIIPKKYIKISDSKESKKIKLVIKIDKKLKKISKYEKTIRPILKRIFGHIISKQIIDGKELLKYDNDEFVDIVYRSILFREAEESGKQNAIAYLNTTGVDKVDLIYNIINSEEGKLKNVKVVGIKRRKIFLNIKRALYRIPILGYFSRILVNICLLPKRFTYIQNAIYDLYSQVRFLYDNYNCINREIEVLNEIKANIQANYENIKIIKADLNVELNNLIDRTNDLEQFKLSIVNFERDNKSRLKVEKELMDKFYVRYNEVLMSDSRDDVKNRAKIYIDKLNNHFKDRNKEELIIIDLGCGECEWIELLNENGYYAKGVDSNSSVVKKVRMNMPNINIEEIDAFSFLKGLEDNSVDMLSSFHMVEHLDMLEVIKLLAECKRVIRSGGLIIMETPNPQNILTSTYYFNMDPTHNKPIPPELLAFFVNESGLHVKEKVLLYPLNFIPYEYKDDDPIKDIVFRFNMEQAYSVLAVKE